MIRVSRPTVRDGYCHLEKCKRVGRVQLKIEGEKKDPCARGLLPLLVASLTAFRVRLHDVSILAGEDGAATSFTCDTLGAFDGRAVLAF